MEQMGNQKVRLNWKWRPYQNGNALTLEEKRSKDTANQKDTAKRQQYTVKL